MPFTKTVLVVEDDSENLRMICRLLQRAKLVTIEATNLEEATGVMTAREVDCVLLDLSLPDAGPEQSLEAIPVLGRDGAVPVVVYTGVDEEALITKAWDCGAAAFVTKGSGADMIVEKIRMAISRKHPEDRENGKAIWRNRHEHARPFETLPWLTTAKAILALAVVIIGQIIAGGLFIWQQSSDNTLFHKQVADNTDKVRAFEPRIAVVETKSVISEQDRAVLNKRIDSYQSETAAIRKDMNDGFNRLQATQTEIYKILIEKQRQP